MNKLGRYYLLLLNLFLAAFFTLVFVAVLMTSNRSTSFLLGGSKANHRQIASVSLRQDQPMGPTFVVVSAAQAKVFAVVPKTDCSFADRAASESLIGVIDLNTHKLINTVSFPGNALAAQLTADEDYLYVSNSYDDRVTIIDTQTYEVVKTIPVGENPTQMSDNTCLTTSVQGRSPQPRYNYKPQFFALSRDGRYMYVTNARGKAVSVFETGDHTLVTRIAVDEARAQAAGSSDLHILWGIATHPLKDIVYVSEKGGNLIWVINTQTNQIQDIIQRRPQDKGVIPVMAPLGLAVTPNGDSLYVADALSGELIIFNTRTMQEEAAIFMGGGNLAPGWISFDKTGQLAYITEVGGNSVYVFDTGKREIKGRLNVKGEPFMVAVAQDKELVIPQRNGDSVDFYSR